MEENTLGPFEKNSIVFTTCVIAFFIVGRLTPPEQTHMPIILVPFLIGLICSIFVYIGLFINWIVE